MNPFAHLSQPIAIPPWRGQAQAYHPLDRAPRITIKVERKKPLRRGRSLKPWLLLAPGSDMERAILALPASHFWKLRTTSTGGTSNG